MTPADLAKALNAAASDFTIPADYRGPLTLRDRTTPLKITAEPGAVLSSVAALNCAEVRFVGLTVRLVPVATTPLAANAVKLSGCRNIKWLGGEISSAPAVAGVPFGTSTDDPKYDGRVIGLPVGRGFYAENCSDVEISGAEIHDVHKGIVLASVDGLTVRGNDVHHVRSSTLTGGKVQRAVIEANRFHHASPYRNGGRADDHADFLHLWTGTANDPGKPCLGYRITDNLMDQEAGYPLMGIYLDDNGTGVGFADFRIADNDILTSHGQAILIENGRGSVLRNQLLQVTDPDFTPRNPSIAIKGGKVEVFGNRACDIYKLFVGNPGNVALPVGARPAGELEQARWAWARRRGL